MPGPLQYFLLLPLLFVLSTSYSQNIESIGADKPIKISGGLSANQIFYSSSANSSRNPYNYYLGGSIALDIYGLQLPFSFTYSNQKSNFRQPFNQFSLHPTYKWVTGHFGYVSTSYSPYTVNGHVFRGGTIDLSPGDKWQIGVMVGQLQKAIDDTSDSVDNNSAYQRIGYGLRMRYGTNSDYVQFVLFKSSDDTGSLPDVAYEFIQPEENLAVSISFSKMVLKKLLIQAEYSGSAVSRDILAAASTTKSHPLSYLTWIFTPRNSSEYYNAYNTQLTYQAKSFTIGMRYEQVGADYRTHGAYYFNNNFYNLTANSNISLAAGRVNVAVNLGFQQDDPQNIKLSRTTRVVGSANLALTPSDRLNLGLGYSNFTTYTNINKEYLDASFLTPYDRIDTLNYYQVSQNATINANYVLTRNKNKTQGIQVNFSAMETRDQQADLDLPGSSYFFLLTTGYNCSLIQPGINFSAILNLQKDSNPISGTQVLGPTLAISKSYFERRLLTSLAVSYNHVSGNNVKGRTLNSRLSANYRLKESHNFQASIISIKRNRGKEVMVNSNDFTASIGYNYSF